MEAVQWKDNDLFSLKAGSDKSRSFIITQRGDDFHDALFSTQSCTNGNHIIASIHGYIFAQFSKNFSVWFKNIHPSHLSDAARHGYGMGANVTSDVNCYG